MNVISFPIAVEWVESLVRGSVSTSSSTPRDSGSVPQSPNNISDSDCLLTIFGRPVIELTALLTLLHLCNGLQR
jgi:hypothetical protein